MDATTTKRLWNNEDITKKQPFPQKEMAVFSEYERDREEMEGIFWFLRKNQSKARPR